MLSIFLGISYDTTATLLLWGHNTGCVSYDTKATVGIWDYNIGCNGGPCSSSAEPHEASGPVNHLQHACSTEAPMVPEGFDVLHPPM